MAPEVAADSRRYEQLVAVETKLAGVVWFSFVEHFRAETGLLIKMPRKEGFVDPAEAKLSVLDHGFVYGGGVFEGINFCNSEGRVGVLFLKEHVERMYQGAQQIRLGIPLLYENDLKEVEEELARRIGAERARAAVWIAPGESVVENGKTRKEKRLAVALRDGNMSVAFEELTNMIGKEDARRIVDALGERLKDRLAEKILAAVEQAVKEKGMKEGYIRPILTRGVGVQLGITAECFDPSLFIYVCPPPSLFSKEAYERGLSVEISQEYRRISTSQMNITNLKWLGYVMNTEAKAAANKRGFNDALMMVDVIEKMDEDGEGGRFKRYLSEASAANVFIVKGGVLKTPDLECNCLNGVTRNAIIRLAREKGLTVIEGKITEKELMDADEVFETGTAAGVIAITSINGKKIGNGTEGEMTRMLREAYNNEVIPRSLTFIRETAVIPAERRKVPVS